MHQCGGSEVRIICGTSLCELRNRDTRTRQSRDRGRRFVTMDFALARRMMVDGQVRTSDVTNLDLITAMLEVPRERFVPSGRADIAYLDRDVPLDNGSRQLLKPMVLAKLIQAADVQAGDRVLDLACATGYSTAILSRLAASVVALEEDPDLAQRAT